MPCIAIAIAAIIVAFIFLIISTRRSLSFLDENVSNALSQIGVQLDSLWDTLNVLFDLTKDYDNKLETLAETVRACHSITKDSSPNEVAMQEKSITEAIEKIRAAVQSYPDLKSNQIYDKLMNSIHLFENRMRSNRMIYNDSVTKLNSILRFFPTSLIAGILGFRKREYLEAAGDKTERPNRMILKEEKR